MTAESAAESLLSSVVVDGDSIGGGGCGGIGDKRGDMENSNEIHRLLPLKSSGTNRQEGYIRTIAYRGCYEAARSDYRVVGFRVK